MTPAEHLALWGYHAVAAGLSPKTVTARDRAVTGAATLGGVEVTELQQLDIVHFVGRPDLAPWSRRVYFLHLREWHRWLVAQGIRPDNPTDGLRAPRAPRMTPRPMSDAQLRHALATAGPRTFVYLDAGGLRRDAGRGDRGNPGVTTSAR
jgi:site-specific recombinase XerC